MDDAVIAAVAAALAAEEEAGGLPSSWEEGGGAAAAPRARTRHTDSVSGEESFSSGCPSPLAASIGRPAAVLTKYFIGRKE